MKKLILPTILAPALCFAAASESPTTLAHDKAKTRAPAGASPNSVFSEMCKANLAKAAGAALQDPDNSDYSALKIVGVYLQSSGAAAASAHDTSIFLVHFEYGFDGYGTATMRLNNGGCRISKLETDRYLKSF